eukprot:scaffold11239_cov101-Skeletonema_marinoi.AAC.1
MRALKLWVVQQHFLTTHFEGIEAKQTHLTIIAIYCRSSSTSLARQPFDPEALPDLLEQVTGHRWERSASTSTSAASASVPSASTPHLAAAAVAAAAAAAAAEQRVVKEGVDAVMYGGCMAAAMKAFDNVVRENAREDNIRAPNPDGNVREDNIHALNPDGDNNPAALDNATMCDMEYTCKASGQPTDYSRPKSPPKRSRTNDGRAPDTNKALFPNIKQSTRPKPGQSNKLKIKEVAPLDSVLDKIHQKKFDEARPEVTEWNCESSPGMQFGDAMKELLCFEFYNEYSFCTGDGGEMKCSNYDEYHDNTDGWSSRGQMRENIFISARDLKKGLQAHLDRFFNEGGSGEEVDCGVGTKLVQNERGKYNDCDGKRTIQRVITDGPPMLILERGIMAWEQSQIAPRSRTVDCMGELEHFLRIGRDHRYVKMKWINADTPFPKDYAVSSLWYKLVDDDSKAEIASAFAKSTPATQQPALIQKRSISDSKILISNEPVAKKVRNRKKYAKGISVACVSNKGRQPQCQLCREQISRQEWHTVKTTSGKQEPWTNTAHYHFRCYNYLTQIERQQLLSLLDQGNYMDCTELDELDATMDLDSS